MVIGKDGTNAYNSTERNRAVNLTAKTFSATERLVKWLYGTASILRSTENEFVWGGDGAFQGDALGVESMARCSKDRSWRLQRLRLRS